jgi:hypothetical protein
MIFFINVFFVRPGIKIKMVQPKNPVIVRVELKDSDREKGQFE